MKSLTFPQFCKDLQTRGAHRVDKHMQIVRYHHTDPRKMSSGHRLQRCESLSRHSGCVVDDQIKITDGYVMKSAEQGTDLDTLCLLISLEEVVSVDLDLRR